MTETYALTDDLKHLVALLQCDNHVVEVGHLGRPGLYVLKTYLIAVLVFQTLLDGSSLRRFCVNLQYTFASNKVLADCQILDMHLRTGIQIYLASNTCEAPEILVLQVRAVAPAHHLHGNQVLAFLQVLGNVELGSYL